MAKLRCQKIFSTTSHVPTSSKSKKILVTAIHTPHFGVFIGLNNGQLLFIHQKEIENGIQINWDKLENDRKINGSYNHTKAPTDSRIINKYSRINSSMQFMQEKYKSNSKLHNKTLNIKDDPNGKNINNNSDEINNNKIKNEVNKINKNEINKINNIEINKINNNKINNIEINKNNSDLNLHNLKKENVHNQNSPRKSPRIFSPKRPKPSYPQYIFRLPQFFDPFSSHRTNNAIESIMTWDRGNGTWMVLVGGESVLGIGMVKMEEENNLRECCSRTINSFPGTTNHRQSLVFGPRPWNTTKPYYSPYDDLLYDREYNSFEETDTSSHINLYTLQLIHPLTIFRTTHSYNIHSLFLSHHFLFMADYFSVSMIDLVEIDRIIWDSLSKGSTGGYKTSTEGSTGGYKVNSSIEKNSNLISSTTPISSVNNYKDLEDGPVEVNTIKENHNNFTSTIIDLSSLYSTNQHTPTTINYSNYPLHTLPLLPSTPLYQSKSLITSLCLFNDQIVLGTVNGELIFLDMRRGCIKSMDIGLKEINNTIYDITVCKDIRIKDVSEINKTGEKKTMPFIHTNRNKIKYRVEDYSNSIDNNTTLEDESKIKYRVEDYSNSIDNNTLENTTTNNNTTEHLLLLRTTNQLLLYDPYTNHFLYQKELFTLNSQKIEQMRERGEFYETRECFSMVIRAVEGYRSSLNKNTSNISNSPNTSNTLTTRTSNKTDQLLLITSLSDGLFYLQLKISPNYSTHLQSLSGLSQDKINIRIPSPFYEEYSGIITITNKLTVISKQGNKIWIGGDNIQQWEYHIE